MRISFKECIAKHEPSEEAGATTSPLYEVNPDRKLAHSPSHKDQGFIAVLATRHDLDFYIVDVETEVPITPYTKENLGSSFVGYAETPRGVHLYFSDRLNVDQKVHFAADELYEQCSEERGTYTERLFNPDGTSRPLPVVVDATCGEMDAHLSDWSYYRKVALQAGLNKPQPEAHEPLNLKDFNTIECSLRGLEGLTAEAIDVR